MLGTFTLSSGYSDQYYLQAQKVRTLLSKTLSDYFKKYDALISLTSPGFAKKLVQLRVRQCLASSKTSTRAKLDFWSPGRQRALLPRSPDQSLSWSQYRHAQMARRNRYSTCRHLWTPHLGTAGGIMPSNPTAPNYQLVCGMEIHAELATESKCFCGCKMTPLVLKNQISIPAQSAWASREPYPLPTNGRLSGPSNSAWPFIVRSTSF